MSELALHLTPSESAPPGFPFLENHVRAQLGIAKDEIRALRTGELRNGTDWCLKKKRVWLAQSGVDALLKTKQLAPLPGRPSAQTPNANAGEGNAEVSQKNAALKSETVTLKVVQLCRNPHIIQCCPADDDVLQPERMVRVRVREAKNFRRSMELPATLVAGYTDLYDLARACPKKPGKW